MRTSIFTTFPFEQNQDISLGSSVYWAVRMICESVLLFFYNVNKRSQVMRAYVTAHLT